MKAKVTKKMLRLAEPFGIARGTTTERESVFVELESGGLGEAAPVRYRGQSLEGEFAALQAMVREVPDAPWDFEGVLGRLRAKYPENTAALAALDMALHDWAGKQLGVPVFRLFQCAPPSNQQTSFTIGIDTQEVMLRKVAEARQYPVLKIKLGRDVEQDIRVMRAIRQAEPRKTLRVDANAGWSLEDARRAIPVMAELGVEYVEQPLAIGAFEALATLARESPLPIFVDEDIDNSRDIPNLAGKCHGVNFKLMKCGGLLEARKIIATARAHGLQIMIGGMIESSLAITAGAQIATLIDYHDLDGHLLISNDPYEGMTLEGEGRWMRLPEDRPGLGVIERPAAA